MLSWIIPYCEHVDWVSGRSWSLSGSPSCPPVIMTQQRAWAPLEIRGARIAVLQIADLSMHAPPSRSQLSSRRYRPNCARQSDKLFGGEFCK